MNHPEFYYPAKSKNKRSCRCCASPPTASASAAVGRPRQQQKRVQLAWLRWSFVVGGDAQRRLGRITFLWMT